MERALEAWPTYGATQVSFFQREAEDDPLVKTRRWVCSGHKPRNAAAAHGRRRRGRALSPGTSGGTSPHPCQHQDFWPPDCEIMNV